MTVWQRTGIHEETCPALSPSSFINEQSHEVWGRECVLSKLLPDLNAICRIRGGEKFFLKCQFRGQQSYVGNPHFVLHPFEISLQLKGRIMLNGAWTPAWVCSLFAWKQDLNPTPLFSWMPSLNLCSLLSNG